MRRLIRGEIASFFNILAAKVIVFQPKIASCNLHIALKYGTNFAAIYKAKNRKRYGKAGIFIPEACRSAD
jgi:hypothetical protein